MTDREELEWVARLGPTRERQIAVLRDLLRRARNDEMSGTDVAICRRHLMRLYVVVSDHKNHQT